MILPNSRPKRLSVRSASSPRPPGKTGRCPNGSA
ncbi:unnamed protein product [Rhizoctonia solani]|uniref:Uncharacterized protein n=1 Tax=Rhizoctonia solani TaxID=456999 RepID=A0A8H3BZH2_9AGAM|nr:unnamed protein product [Rhizoctonia solani]